MTEDMESGPDNYGRGGRCRCDSDGHQIARNGMAGSHDSLREALPQDMHLETSHLLVCLRLRNSNRLIVVPCDG
jgi:hypothetical protein